MNTRALHFLRIICLALLWPALVTAQSRFIEVDKIVAGDKGTYDEFGSSVSISGDYAIVGAPFEYPDGKKNAGAAYIFERGSNGTWAEVTKIVASDGEADDEFGYSVSISGDYAIVGAWKEDPDGEFNVGSAYIFERGGTGMWAEVAKIVASDGKAFDEFGYSVSISGDYAIVGVPSKGYSAGAAYIFERGSTGTWAEVTKIVASDGATFDVFGQSVSISGSHAIVGAPFEDPDGKSKAGAAYIFERGGTGMWAEVAKIVASDGAGSEEFGGSVAISGDYAIVGAMYEGESVVGAAYIFERDGTGMWAEITKILASDKQYNDQFGSSVSISGDYAIVGARQEDPGGTTNAGAAYIFKRDNNGTWAEVTKIVASDKGTDDEFGKSVSISGNYAIAGAPFGDPGGTTDAGAAYLFEAVPNRPPDCSNVAIADQIAGANCSATISGADVTGITDPDGDALTITVSPTNLVLGANSVTVTADDGKGGTCSTILTVNVVDDTPPAITCPADTTVDAAPGATGAVVNFNVTATDNCSVTVACTPASGSFFPLGTTTVTCTATDAGGNTATCTFDVTVQPPLPHSFTLLADRDIFIDGQSFSDGALHANNDIKFKDGTPSTHTGDLTAVDDIKIDDDNTIDGDVTAGDKVELADEVVVTGTVTANAAVATEELPVLSFSAGGDDITVPKNGTQSLAPGSYGNVRVKKGGTLVLNHTGITGEYFFDKLLLGKGAVLSIDAGNGPIAVNVVDRLVFGKASDVVINSPLGSNSRFVTFNSLDKVQVGKAARVLGNVIAPEDEVTLKKGASFRGTICAAKIVVKKAVTFLHHDSGTMLPKSSAPVLAKTKGDDAENAALAAVPTEFVLEQNYPNPFNPSTTIRFALPEAGAVSLSIYDPMGRLVRTLVSGEIPAGSHRVVWDARDDSGVRVASGLYLYTLRSGAVVLQRKLVLMK